MQLNKYLNIFYTVATLVLFIACQITANDNQSEPETSLDQLIDQQLEKEQIYGKQSHHTHFKRKRRYLEFPEGSSFQLVYDLIVGVVDYTNYLILGVTVALAWELPSKPPSEILSDLTTRLKDGTLGNSRNDTIENIKYIDSKTNATKSLSNKYYFKPQPIFKPPMHYKYYVNRQPDSFYKIQDQRNSQRLKDYQGNGKLNWRRKNNSYYTKKQHPFTKWTQNKNIQNYSSRATKYPWWNLPTRLKNSFIERPSLRRFDQNINHSRQQTNRRKPIQVNKAFPGTGRSEHRIFPVFGKRSIADKTQNETLLRHRRSGINNDNLSTLDRIHIKHHRSTRHDLYERIETYLDGRGSNGHHCVLRALCETGQKSHEHKPGSFVAEIMRAIFTLPEHLDAAADGRHQLGHKEQRYDTANSLVGDCASRYNLCKESLWSSHFVA